MIEFNGHRASSEIELDGRSKSALGARSHRIRVTLSLTYQRSHADVPQIQR
jgi:hypothetical protein